VISCDEKTGIQALTRETTPMKPNQCERHDSSYERHGTQCLIANFEVATGKVISPTIGDTRTEDVILDQLNTHKSASLVEYVTKACELEIDLGEKGKNGILKDMESRKNFLENSEHRIRFFYTPKHASWLNQVEIWFSILSARLLKRLYSESKEALKNKITSFIDYFNKTAAKVFKWTYKGRPLVI